MKFLTALLTSAIALALTACDDRSVKKIDTETLLKNISNPDYVLIDTRQDSLYNGFKDKNAIRGGHIKGAIQFTTEWLDGIAEDKFESFAAGKGITKEKTLVFYDSNPDNLERVSAELPQKATKFAYLMII